MGIAFIGVCHRHQQHGEGNPWFGALDLIGLGRTVLAPVFPVHMSGIGIVLAVDPLKFQPGRLRIRSAKGDEVVFADSHLEVELNKGPAEPVAGFPAESIPFWHTFVWAFTDVDALVLEPGFYVVTYADKTREIPLGVIAFVLTSTQPLTEERRAAIRSRPWAAKGVILEIGCKKCPSKLKVYCGLDQNEGEKGSIWYANLPDSFVCECGSTKIPLTYLRSNMHALLEEPGGDPSRRVVRLYEDRALASISKGFAKVIEVENKEELVQQFISKNPLLFHFLGADRIFQKPTILGRFTCDFAVLTSDRDLVLIEIERPGLKLLRKSGEPTAELNHAFNQVEDWLFQTDEHRQAVLDVLRISPKSVGRIRGLVVAGRKQNADSEQLRRFKARDFGRVSFMTYDDLARGLETLAERIRQV